MLNKDILISLKQWFSDYVGTFEGGPPDHQWNIRLKIDHTCRVCQEIIDIGRSLSLTPEELCLVETLALFHDIGRFEQFTRYRTFADHKSEDHAQLGIKILKDNDVLKTVPGHQQELILKIVGYHNHARLPEEESAQFLLYLKLLRDADKLDIWRIVTDYYRNKERMPDAVIGLSLPDTPDISPEVFEDFRSRRIVLRQHIRNLNDFKLHQICWIYDVNFPLTFQLVKKRNYIQLILDEMTGSPKISEITNVVNKYLNEQTVNSEI